jgi:peptidoglycan/xylan/chitin deacetylase (PgdA/CDA1 family)
MRTSSRPVVTTSWDDGHPLDLRVAAVLARYGLRGTFYVPLLPVAARVLGRTEMRELLDMGMEIGSHTVTHAVLTELPDAEADRELSNSRRMLEDSLGVEVSSFCYPKGRFSTRITRRARLAGYRLCRTTVDFRTGVHFDPVRMPVSLQLFPHGASAYYRHALRHRNWRGLWNWRGRFGGATELEGLASRMLDRIREHGGVFHLWGHSWEIEERGLWPLLDRVAAMLAGLTEAVRLTNRELSGIGIPAGSNRDILGPERR